MAGIGFEHQWLPVGLAVIGIFVGLVNVVDVDTNKFLPCPIPVLTGTVGFSSKRRLIEKFAVTGPAPCSGARGDWTRGWT